MPQDWRFNLSVMGMGENHLIDGDTCLSDLNAMKPWGTYQGIICVNATIGKLSLVRLKGRLQNGIVITLLEGDDIGSWIT